MRFKLSLCLFFIAAALLASCSISKDGVKLLSEKEMQEIAERDHGNVTFLRSEKNTGSNTYYFMDNTYGFEFSMSSFASSRGMDGSTFFYDKGFSDNWISSYGNFLQKNAIDEINTDLNENGGDIFVDLETANSSSVSAELHFIGEFSNLRTQLKTVCERIAAADTAKSLSDEMHIYKGSGDLYEISIYHISTGLLDDPETIRKTNMFNYVEVVMGEEIERGDVKILSSPDEVPGLSQIGYESDHKNEFCYPYVDVHLYYFRIDGKDYFITNILRADNMTYYIADADGKPYNYN